MFDGRRTVVAAAAVLAVLGVLALGWIGSELHYRNCLSSAELRYPVAFMPDRVTQVTTLGGVPIGNLPAGVKNPTPGQVARIDEDGISKGFAFYEQARRADALGSCSHWP